jgi:hypothetical protein
MVIVILMVLLNFRDGVSVIKVVDSFVKGMVGWGRFIEEVMVPTEEGLCNISRWVVRIKEEVNGM